LQEFKSSGRWQQWVGNHVGGGSNDSDCNDGVVIVELGLEVVVAMREMDVLGALMKIVVVEEVAKWW
ncbi:hypothetical protein Ancab_032559, partial [Ancistrocladus abbreviatus]